MTDRHETRAVTHADDCWSWGPGHYDCAVREIERLRGALEECHARSVARWQRLLAAEAERKRLLRKKLTAAAEHPALTEAEVLAAAKRMGKANGACLVSADEFWNMIGEGDRENFLCMARAALGVEADAAGP